MCHKKNKKERIYQQNTKCDEREQRDIKRKAYSLNENMPYNSFS